MPLFVWASYATSWIQVLATPIIGITLLLVVIERLFGVGIFDPTLAGILSCSSICSGCILTGRVHHYPSGNGGSFGDYPVFARRTIFGYKFIAYSSLAIAFVGSLGGRITCSLSV